MANFLHGVETIELQQGARTVQVVKSAVIGLVGIAPKGESNIPVAVTSDRDAAKFGAKVPGFSIPQALDAIFKQGAGTVIVINVFDPQKHTQKVEKETQKVTNRRLKLNNSPLGYVQISDDEGDATAYIEGEDYTLDPYGNFTVLSAAIAEGATLMFSYSHLNASAVLPADIIGAVDPDTEERTGTKCFSLSYNLFGFSPKILIAPGYSQVNGVATELIALAETFRAIAYLDAPLGTTVANAIAGRGPAGTINFSTSSKRAELLYPHLKVYDPASDTNQLMPYSAFLAGVRAAVDNAEGFWVSASNHEIKGIVGAEKNITAGISDANSEANRLNEAGITTIFNSFGTGIRVWGNRSASYPTNTAPDNFVAVRRTADIIHESVEQACLQFIDRPITQGWIDSVRETVNSFLRTLQGRGAILDGVCKYNPEDNPKTELANGHVTFYIDFMPPTPAERITFNSFINIDYLNSLN